MTRALTAVAIAIAIAVPRTGRAADLKPRVLVLPTEGAAPSAMPTLGGDVADAIARGAARTTPNVARADATLDDTAVIVGCDATTRDCLDAVAAALNVDQVVYARIKTRDGDPAIEVTAITREAEPQTRTFTIHAASRSADLATVEPAVADMLESGEARRDQAKQPATTTTATLPPPPPPPPPAPPRPAWPIAVTAGGAAVAIAGAVCWGVASSKQSDIDHAPTATVEDLDHLAALETSGRRYATAGNVMVVGGAIVAAAGAALWWRSWREHDVAIAPAVQPGAVSLVIGGAW